MGVKNDKQSAILNMESIVESVFKQQLKAIYLTKGIYDAISEKERGGVKVLIYNMPVDRKSLSEILKEFRVQNSEVVPFSQEDMVDESFSDNPSNVTEVQPINDSDSVEAVTNDTEKDTATDTADSTSESVATEEISVPKQDDYKKPSKRKKKQD